MVGYAYNPSSGGKAEVGGPRNHGHTWLHQNLEASLAYRGSCLKKNKNKDFLLPVSPRAEVCSHTKSPGVLEAFYFMSFQCLADGSIACFEVCWVTVE